MPGITNILNYAVSHGILVFASAGNDGENTPIPFPARLNNVFCIGATDGLGKPKNFSPSAKGIEIYSTLGEAVSAASDPENCSLDCFSSQRRDGTSVACPIAAGIAALFLDYTRRFGDSLYDAGNWTTMRKLFLGMSGGKEYGYLTPWQLVSPLEPQTFANKIQETIRNPASENPP